MFFQPHIYINSQLEPQSLSTLTILPTFVLTLQLVIEGSP